MTERKFFFVLFLVSALFLAAFSGSGCGGGGGGSNNDSYSFRDDYPPYDYPPYDYPPYDDYPSPRSNDVPPIPSDDIPPISEDNTARFTVTFNSNGGSAVQSLRVSSGSTIERPDDPTRSGYIFENWYKDDSFIEPFVFGTDGDKVYASITLYGHWLEGTLDGLQADYALSSVTPEYAQGDNPEHVTRNISLPVSTDEVPDAIIRWSSSNPSAVSSLGAVTRPQGSDLRVTLTASVTIGSETRTRDFGVRVMHRNERVRSEISNYSVIDIQNMNSQDKRSHISYNPDKTQVRRIQGRFSDVNVQTADDALDAIQSVHSVLGVRNPYDELEPAAVNYSETGPKYRFSQVHDGVQVYGRGITVSANENGNTNFLQSSFFASSLLDNAALTERLTKTQAESYAKDHYSTEIEVDSDSTELGIYSLEEYETSPILIYRVSVSGSAVDDTVYVNASNGEIVKVISHSTSLVTVTGWGETELGGDKVSFDIEFALGNVLLAPHFFYYMYDKNLHVQMHVSPFGMDGNAIGGEVQIASDFNLWLDKHEVSAYYNMRKVAKWWRDTLGRNSIDGNGSNVKVITHANHENAAWTTWTNGKRRLRISANKYPDYTCAAAFDVLVHESGHGVMDYIVNDVNTWEAMETYMGKSIKEGYADIFACLAGGNWRVGEELYQNQSGQIRDVLNRRAHPRSETYYWNSLNLSHAAYLMHEGTNSDGHRGIISSNRLASLWYESMKMGLDATTTLDDIRAYVIFTAEAMNFSEEEIYCIVESFKIAGIFGRSTLSGVITSSDVPLANVSIRAEEPTLNSSQTETTDSQGYYMIEGLDWGTYNISANEEGYVPFSTTQLIDESEDVELNIRMVRRVPGNLSGTIYNAQTGELLSGVYLELREGWNNTEGDAITNRSTGPEGTYTFQDLAGYYTVNMICNGFITSSFNVLVIGDTINQNGYLSPTMNSSANYRVVLSWGEDPADIDAHLTAPSSSGGTIEVYYNHKLDYDSLGNTISLDLDVIRDSNYDDNSKRYWPETITFVAEPEGTYEYFVHWFRGTGSWASCGAVVRLYTGGSPEPVRTWTVPVSETTDHCWRVFRIQNGIVQDINSFSSERHEGDSSSRTSSYSTPYFRK